MASYYVSKSKSRWGDLFSHTKSGIACISGSEVYSLHRHLEESVRENCRFKDLAADHEALNTEMELAKMKMNETRKQIQMRRRKKKDATNNLCQQFADQRGRMDEMMRKEEETRKMIEGLHAKIVELKRSNLGLVNDKIELLNKMDSVKEGMIIEEKALEKALKEATRLRISNGELAKQVEMYQSERQEDVHELVYLRRIITCLRYELQKKHRPREMNSMKKERKGVNVVVGIEKEGVRKCNGYDIDCSSASTEIEAINSSRDSGSSWMSAKKAKLKLIAKIKKWRDTEGNHGSAK